MSLLLQEHNQIIMKLKYKGMIIKDTDPRNMSRLVLSLTEKGETAYMNHEKLHQKYDQLFNIVLQTASEENKIFLKDFLNSLDRQIDIYAEKYEK